MIDPKNVHATLSRHQLADGMPIVLDLRRSHGSWLCDEVTGDEYLDFFTCFASWPIGWNHPAMQEPEFLERIRLAGSTNPSNADLYTTLMAEFVSLFATRVTPPGYPHHFWISGGALAVENALKVAFDWKARKIGVDRCHDGDTLAVMHFRHAFHGRSGYTLSLTNTDPVKTALFPKFRWPRIHSPALHFDLAGNVDNDVETEERRAVAEMETAFRGEFAGRVACVIVEPMQAEGGDRHFRPEFLAELRRLCDEHDALLVLDEVQTGFFSSGTPWMWQSKGVAPDVVAFGKKTQVCGLYANTRVDDVPDNVFHKASRINSTWGGSLVDMVRATQIIRIVLDEHLGDNVARQGERLLAGLRSIASDSGAFDNVRGQGSLVALDRADRPARDALLRALRAHRLLALPSGDRAVRFRLPLNVTAAEIDAALERVAAALPDCARA
ncbi:MAG: L-lysine 6-transaminase [Planctomycetes bacterium]|nr:L-lysine 6-transaminase [Planctomycetota bacterium]